MLDPYLQLFRVNMADGTLKNTDGVYEIDALGPDGATKFLQMGNVFQGGNWLHLHKMLHIKSGDEILYVGDHLYSDVLRSKRTLGWRSMFIMPELEEEIKVFSDTLEIRQTIAGLRKLRGELIMKSEEVRRTSNDQLDDDEATMKLLEELKDDDATIKSALAALMMNWHASFHPIWGAMFNAGYQDSRFAFYVENYACLYSSKASNLGLTSSVRPFRPSMEMVPHDRVLAQPDTILDTTDPW